MALLLISLLHVGCAAYKMSLMLVVLFIASGRQITEAEQRHPDYYLDRLPGARITMPAMYWGVGQASHIMPSLSTHQQWWVPGGMKSGELWMALAADNALNSPGKRWDHIRGSSSTMGVNCEVCWLDGISDYKHTHLHLFSHLTCMVSNNCACACVADTPLY